MRETSYAAKASLKDDLPRLQRLVLDHVRGTHRHGSTCDEAEVELDLSHQTCSARFYDLHRKDLIRDSGERRLTRSGRTAIVWVKA